jgi:pimeloyl-ACP methyl ester carboxylesterase
LSVAEYGTAVSDRFTARGLGPVLLAGHSIGTQVAAEAAAGHPDVSCWPAPRWCPTASTLR